MAEGFALGTRPDGAAFAVDPSDLTTHGVIVGMTGSGKTGLGIVLLEEALSAGVPVLALDPKGDLGNLLLTFPDLAPADFAPWVEESQARDAGLPVEEHAARVAAEWREGLAASGIDPERIRALRESSELTIYTPGSTAGTPLNLVGSLAAAPLSWETDAETLRDQIEAAVSGVLGLVGIPADPLGSREHVLLANLVERAWRAGTDLDLAALIGQVQSPPLRKLGVFDVDTFFPQKERTALALRLNALAASPSFAAWSKGEPLDPERLVGGGERTNAAIVHLAHLSEPERQFVVTLLLSKVVTWMRRLPGTGELRTLVYMDEVAGYAPPTAAPPTKKPILTLLKQARAYGVGAVLATQNPVDLDYKAMANAGTWFVGRLQTERDKQRVVEGLRSAAGGTEVAALDAAIGGLAKRQFLVVSAHEPEPALFTTRWAMSYLRGPLTKDEVARLAGSRERAADDDAEEPTIPPAAPAGPAPAPPVARGVQVRHVHPSTPWLSSVGGDPAGRRLRAFLAARLSLRYDDTALGLDTTEEWEALYGPLDDGLDLASEAAVDYDERDFVDAPPAAAEYVSPAAPIGDERLYQDAGKEIARRVGGTRTLTVFRNRPLKLVSRPSETEEEFAARADEAAQARADAETARIRDRLESRRDRLEATLATARRRVAELETEQRSRATTELVAGAGAVLGVLLGGRGRARSIARAGGALGGAASRRGMTTRAAERRRTAGEKIETVEVSLEELEQQILDEVAEIDATWSERAREIEPVEVRLEQADVRLVELALVWVPTA